MVSSLNDSTQGSFCLPLRMLPEKQKNEFLKEGRAAYLVSLVIRAGSSESWVIWYGWFDRFSGE